MPWKSERQRRWGNSEEGQKKLGSSKVKEFNDATQNTKLPESKKKGSGVVTMKKPKGIDRLRSKLSRMK